MYNIRIEYNHSIYEIEFISTFKFHNYPGVGKCWPKTTQCVIRKGLLIIGIGTVTKHIIDNDNPKYARKYSMKKALTNSPLKYWDELRSIMWDEINKL